MRVFISWSGSRSEYIAEAMHEWLPNIIQAIRPWMSASDIDKGSRWSSDLASKLEETRFGIICLTPENLLAPWILFEAGALSKTLQNTYVCPYLFDLDPTDLIGPLVQFQAAKTQKEDTRKLVHSINQALDNLSLPETRINNSFDVWWPILEKRLASVPAVKDVQTQKRSEKELLEEILELVRTQARILLSPTPTSVENSLEQKIKIIQEEIYSLLTKENDPLTALEIAVRIKWSRPDVTRALHKLRDEGLVRQVLTEDGVPLYIAL